MSNDKKMIEDARYAAYEGSAGREEEEIEEECEHEIDDEGLCLNCDEDFREELMSRAYDMYKDHMKYGE